MINTIICDFSRVIIFPKDKDYSGSLNNFYQEYSKEENFKFFDYYDLNTSLLKKLEALKTNYSLYIFTSGTLQNAPEIREELDKIFVKIFSSHDIGLQKNQTEAYEKLLSEINKKPEEILFMDDTEENLEAAANAGINVYLFTDNEDVFYKLDNLNGQML